MKDYKKIISNLPLFARKNISIKPLKGGLTNKNFIVQSDSGNFVARFAPKNSSYLGMNKKYEFNNYQIVSRQKIGPKPFKYYPKFNLLVVEYLAGQVGNQKTAKKLQTIKQLALLFKKLHSGPKFRDSIDLFKATKEYYNRARKLSSWEPKSLKNLLVAISDIEKELKDKQWIKPAHLDLMVENIIHTKAGIKLIDWEYSGNADYRFDLAMFSFKADFREQHDRLLLKYYGNKKLTMGALKFMKCLVVLREIGWSLVQIKSSKINFDYKKYALWHINRFNKIWDELKN